MVAQALRIQSEGRVEALEQELFDWGFALGEARARRFDAAARLLRELPVSLASRGDEDLARLLKQRETLRREVTRLVAKRLGSLGMPEVEAPTGARWLAREPVLYEHHRVSPAILPRALHLVAFSVAPPTLVAGTLGAPALGLVVGLVLLVLLTRAFFWSDVMLTSRRLVLEGRVIDLTHAVRVLAVRPFMQYLPERFAVEVRYESGEIVDAHLKFASRPLRAQLRKMGLDTGADWGPW